MKKVLSTVAVALLAASVARAGNGAPGRLGIGYQGVLYDNFYAMNQISLRLAPQPFGGALVFGQMTEDDKDGGSDDQYWLLQAKGFYTLIARKNSDFYLGGSLGGVYSKHKWSGGEDKNTAWLLGALAGVEWNFDELTEIGFNFEIGYNASFDDDDGDDSVLKGTYASLGAHYYF